MRKYKYALPASVVAICLFFMNSTASANDEFPIPVIFPHEMYLGVGQTGYFTGFDSNDPDGEIWDWYWAADDQDDFWGSPVCTYSWDYPGVYDVELYVMDNEYIWSDENPEEQFWFDICDVNVFRADVDDLSGSYWPLNGPIPLNCDPPIEGGDFEWSCSRPGSFSNRYEQDPTFTPTETGLYSVKVRYSVDNSGDVVPQAAYDEDDSEPFWVFGVTINTPASYYVAVGEDLALECEPIPSYFTGGSYDWSASGPGTASFSPDDSTTAYETEFSADEAGEYEVQVAYTYAGVSASDTLATKIQVVELTGLTVANATQTNAKNLAAVKDDGEYVIIEAVLNPTIPDDNVPEVLHWGGDGSPVEGHPLQRKVSKSSSGHTTVTGTVGTTSDYVDIWIIWATGVYRYGSTQQTSSGNEKTFSPAIGGSTLGPMNDEDDGIILETVGKIEGVFTLTPAGVHNVVGNGWDIKRWVTYQDYHNGIMFDSNSCPDDPTNNDEDLTPNNDDKIYMIDSPSINYVADHTAETYNNFTEWVEWNGTVCSDFYFWYYQARVDDDLDAANKPNNDDTELNDVDTGWINMPGSAHYPTRP